ncbi:MAG TPA: DUF917 family protein [Terriglobales bacterium]|nr:DUF917 family protein [Terriglobales bacterium]
MEILTERRLRAMVYGGAVLGGGGGGTIESGLAAGREALAQGKPRFVRLDELPANATIATLSIVGGTREMSSDRSHPLNHMGALRRLRKLSGKSLRAVIPSEVGPQAVSYGWLESAVTGLPVADAPCNGRAHPLGLMGSLGLHARPNHITSTVAIGGSRKDRLSVELVLRSSVTQASRMVRQAAASARIPLAVARNPVPASYVSKHAAVGGLRYAEQVGRIVQNEAAHGLPQLLRRLSRWMGGRVLCEGRVSSAVLADRHGFTLGEIVILGSTGEECKLAVCNEFLALQRERTILAAFPDLITVFDFQSVLPLSSPEISAGKQVAVFAVPRRRLKLGSTMKDVALLHPLERLLNIRLAGEGMQVAATTGHARNGQPT